MCKKRIRRTPLDARHASIRNNRGKFISKNISVHSVEWKTWLNNVKNFYKNYRELSLAPLFTSKPLDNRPYVEVFIFDSPITALVDSGATQSVLGAKAVDILNKFNLKISKCSENFIMTADGKPQKVTGSVDLPIRADNICRVMKVLIVPSLTHTFILGSDFCKNFRIKLDFLNDSWHIRSEESDYEFLVKSSEVSDQIPMVVYSISDLSSEQIQRVEQVKSDYEKISCEDRLGRTDKMKFHIDTGDAKPFRERQYPLSPYIMKLLNKELDEMLKLNVVEPSHSAWNSPVLLVKKSSGEQRFCYDGRALNKVTKPDAYPLPRVDRILSLLKNAKFISSIDLRKAFWQIPLEEDSKEKTAFSIPGRGLFHFNVVPFGLRNSAQCQQRLMDLVLTPKLENNVFCYLDDIIIISETFEEHISILEEVLARLKDAKLTINLSKCQFFKDSLKYLGFVVDSQGLRTDGDKVASLVNFARPTTTTEIKRFIGTASWYRRFIQHFSTLVSPINDLLKGKKKGQAIKWNSAAEDSFLKLKQALVSAPILRSPDFTKDFIVQCDASNTGLGSVLLQQGESGEVVIAFASRSLSKAERNYTVTERECLAVIFSIEKFRPYIEGTHFTIITDHYSLLWLNNMKEPTGKLARWSVKLQQFDFTLVHRKGTLNVVPDFLSRIPSQENPNEQVEIAVMDNESIGKFKPILYKDAKQYLGKSRQISSVDC